MYINHQMRADKKLSATLLVIALFRKGEWVTCLGLNCSTLPRKMLGPRKALSWFRHWLAALAVRALSQVCRITSGLVLYILYVYTTGLVLYIVYVYTTWLVLYILYVNVHVSAWKLFYVKIPVIYVYIQIILFINILTML